MGIGVFLWLWPHASSLFTGPGKLSCGDSSTQHFGWLHWLGSPKPYYSRQLQALGDVVSAPKWAWTPSWSSRVSPDCCQQESEFFSLPLLAPFYFSPISFFRLSNAIFALSSENQNSNLANSGKGIWCECHASTIRGETIGTLSKFCAHVQCELGDPHWPFTPHFLQLWRIMSSAVSPGSSEMTAGSKQLILAIHSLAAECQDWVFISCL